MRVQAPLSFSEGPVSKLSQVQERVTSSGSHLALLVLAPLAFDRGSMR